MEIPEDVQVLTELDFKKLIHNRKYRGRYIFTRGEIIDIRKIGKTIGGIMYIKIQDSQKLFISVYCDYKIMSKNTKYTSDLDQLLNDMSVGDTIEIVACRNHRFECISISSS